MFNPELNVLYTREKLTFYIFYKSNKFGLIGVYFYVSRLLKVGIKPFIVSKNNEKNFQGIHKANLKELLFWSKLYNNGQLKFNLSETAENEIERMVKKFQR